MPLLRGGSGFLKFADFINLGNRDSSSVFGQLTSYFSLNSFFMYIAIIEIFEEKDTRREKRKERNFLFHAPSHTSWKTFEIYFKAHNHN